MAFLSLNNIALKGISAAIPLKKELNSAIELISKEDLEKLIATTGVHERRVADASLCTSDLCFAAAERLIDQLSWEKNSIDILIFVSQTPDYTLPATAPILQHRLGLGNACMAFDISMGCSGYIYGLSVLGSLISHGILKRGLILAGDTISKTCSRNDKSTYPIFGDAGTATALEFSETGNGLKFNLSSDGSDYRSIIIEDGGFRHQSSMHSFTDMEFEGEIRRNSLQISLDGMNVFSFGINRAPESILGLTDKYKIDLNKVDYFVFHQANLFMNEMIRQKLRIPVDKVPYSLKYFGNTSSATIPLTMVANLKERLSSDHNRLLLCGFGVGLSWGSAYLETDRIVCPDILEI